MAVQLLFLDNSPSIRGSEEPFGWCVERPREFLPMHQQTIIKIAQMNAQRIFT